MVVLAEMSDGGIDRLAEERDACTVGQMKETESRKRSDVLRVV